MSTAEGHGIATTIDDIMQIYEAAEIPAPRIIYIERDYCGISPLHMMLSARDQTFLEWHLMRYISTEFTTDSLQLYGQYMDNLSNCIFE